MAGLIGDRPRAAMLLGLLRENRACSARELSFIAGVSATSASGHLHKLVEGGLLRVETKGRHRLYSLSGDPARRVMEALCAFVPGAGEPFVYAEARAIGFCRTCYGHLAGYVGVQIAEAMERHAFLVPSGASKQYNLTSDGSVWLDQLGIRATDLGDGRRKLAFRCHDWTERQYHVGGVLGSALLVRFCELGWVVRAPDSRRVDVTDAGRSELLRELHLELPTFDMLSPSGRPWQAPLQSSPASAGIDPEPGRWRGPAGRQEAPL